MFGMCSGAVFRSCKADCARWMQAEKKKEQLDSFKETSVSHCVPLCPTMSNSFQQLSGLEPLEPLCKSRVRLLLSTVHWWPTVPDTCSGVMSPSSHAMETKNEQSIIEIL